MPTASCSGRARASPNSSSTRRASPVRVRTATAGSAGSIWRLRWPPEIAVGAGWTPVRDPKTYPRFTDRYYASFVEDANGIRIEFMHNPPRDAQS